MTIDQCMRHHATMYEVSLYSRRLGGSQEIHEIHAISVIDPTREDMPHHHLQWSLGGWHRARHLPKNTRLIDETYLRPLIIIRERSGATTVRHDKQQQRLLRQQKGLQSILLAPLSSIRQILVDLSPHGPIAIIAEIVAHDHSPLVEVKIDVGTTAIWRIVHLLDITPLVSTVTSEDLRLPIVIVEMSL